MDTPGENNYNHALTTGICEDLDCEIHYPIVIEDENSRYTACAWFLAGARVAINTALEDFDANVFGNSDDRWRFLGGRDPETDSLGAIRNIETDLLEDR